MENNKKDTHKADVSEMSAPDLEQIAVKNLFVKYVPLTTE